MLSHRSRRRLRDQTMHIARLDSGTPYPCTRRQLESVLHPQGFDGSHHQPHNHHQGEHFENYDYYEEGYVDLPKVFEEDYDFRPIFEAEYGPPSYHGNRYRLPPIFEDGYGPSLYHGDRYDLPPIFEDGYGHPPYHSDRHHLPSIFEDGYYYRHRHQGRRCGGPSAMNAARKLSHHLRKPLTEKESRAATRLRTIHDLTTWGPDIVFKAFVDLSTLFFAGRLQDRVHLIWRSRREIAIHGDPELATAFGYTVPRQMGRKTVIEICLNKDAIFMQEEFKPWKKVWGTLLHEMIVRTLFSNA